MFRSSESCEPTGSMKKKYPFLILSIITAALQAEQIYKIPRSTETLDLDIVSDQNGSVHAIASINDFNNSELNYYISNGKDWEEGPGLASHLNPNRIYGIDLEVDPNGTLHVSYFNDGDAYYGMLTPTSDDWLIQRIDDGTENPSDYTKSILRTSISLKGNIPQVVYNKRSGDSEILSFLATQFNFQTGIQTWVSEEIPNITFGISPVISSDPLPEPFSFVIGDAPVKGPSIAYYEYGEFKITQRIFTQGATPSITWSAPQVLSEGAPSATLENATRLRSELKIQDGILHFLARARNPDTNSFEILYHRWEVTSGVFPPSVSKTFEKAGRPSSTDASLGQSSLALTPQGIPHIAFHANNPTGTCELTRGVRLGPDQWSNEIISTARNVESSVPETNAITIDPLGRTSVITSYQDETLTQINREDEFELSTETFPIPSTSLSDAIPGDLAINGDGGIGYAYQSGEDSATFLYRNPRSGAISSQTLDLATPTETTNIRVRNVLVTAVGQDYHIVATQVTRRSVSGTLTEIEHRLYGFKKGQLISSSRVFFTNGVIIDIPQLSLTGDEQFSYLASFPLVNSPANLIITNPEGIRKVEQQGLESSFRNTIPFGYRDAVLKARDEGLALVGKLNGSLTVYHRDSEGNWEDNLVQETPTDLRDGYDLFLRPGADSYLVSFVDDITIKVADSSLFRPGGENVLQNRTVRDLTASVNTGLSQGSDGVLHVVMKPFDFAAEIIYQSFQGLPADDFNNVITGELVFEQASTESFTFDRYGSPVIVANEFVNGQNTRLLSINPITQDPDGDGMPTFVELAFRRDPLVPDAKSLVEISLSEDSEGKKNIELTFERPSGKALGTRNGLEIGIFAYDLEATPDLNPFVGGPQLFLRTPAAGEVAGPFGNTQKVNFVEPFPGFASRYFFRIVPRLR